jgi:hypothetical protein
LWGTTLDPADRGGEPTKAGRAQQKHGGTEGSAFDPAIGSASDKNAQGQETLTEILGSETRVDSPNKLGGTDAFKSESGRGARFDSEGKFTGFREPKK